MRTLINDIQKLVSKFGKSIVLDKKFLNMLKDVYNFRANPKLLNIIEILYSKGYINKIYKSSKKNIEKDIKSIVSDTDIKLSFEEEDVCMVLFSFAIGINMLNYSEYISLQQKKTKKSKISEYTSYIKHLYKSIDYTNFKLVLTFLIDSIVGLALFYVTEESGWWIFFCTIILIIVDLVCIGLCSNINLDDSTAKPRSIISACGTVGTLKSCVPFFYLKDETSPFSILLILTVVLLWGAGTMSFTFEKSTKYNWSQILFSKTYAITTSFILLIVSTLVFLSPIITIVKNENNKNIKQKHSKIERQLGFKSFYLNGKLPYRTNSIVGLQKRLDIDTLGAKMDIYTFKDELYSDSADVELIYYKGKLAKISLYKKNSTNSEELLKLYTEKYGTPEMPQMPILFWKNPYSMLLHNNWTSNRIWTFKNGTIIISSELLSFSVLYISNIYLKLEEKEYLLEEQKIEEQKRKELQMEEIERQRIDSQIKKEEKLQKEKYNRTKKEI